MFSLWSWRIEESKTFTCFLWEVEESKNPRIQTYFPAEAEGSKNPRIRHSKHLLRNSTLSLSRIEKFKNPSLFSGMDIWRNEQFKNPSRFLLERASKELKKIKNPSLSSGGWSGESKNLRIQADFLNRASGELKNLRIQAKPKILRTRADFWMERGFKNWKIQESEPVFWRGGSKKRKILESRGLKPI